VTQLVVFLVALAAIFGGAAAFGRAVGPIEPKPRRSST
jgi:hypothetical protein